MGWTYSRLPHQKTKDNLLIPEWGYRVPESTANQLHRAWRIPWSIPSWKAGFFRPKDSSSYPAAAACHSASSQEDLSLPCPQASTRAQRGRCCHRAPAVFPDPGRRRPGFVCVESAGAVHPGPWAPRGKGGKRSDGWVGGRWKRLAMPGCGHWGAGQGADSVVAASSGSRHTSA